MRIDVSKLEVALVHKESSQECPFCTRREWTTDEIPAAITPTDPDTDEPTVGAGVPAAILVCKHCGFIRLHAVEVLFEEGAAVR